MLIENDTRVADTLFADYVRDCLKALGSCDPQTQVAILTKDLISRWRMPDNRYLQLQPDAPYASYLLFLSEHKDLCIVLDIFMPGQAAVVHNHLCWCVFGCLEGVERERIYDAPRDLSSPPQQSETLLRHPGDVTVAGAAINDFHQVECHSETPSISLHIYGANIGTIERQMWNAETNRYEQFSGGYTNDVVNLPPYVTTGSLLQAAQDGGVA